MKRPAFSRCRCLLLLAIGCQSAGRAQIATDGSLGSATALTGPNFAIPDSLGKKAGGNLFHSFSEFSLGQTQSATFSGPVGVKNILARVTGGRASSIDGILRSDIDGANLYFINPAGVLFGANARLEIGGAFTVTTADYVRLSDGGRFDARLPASDILTSAPVSAFGFLSASPKAVSFTGSTLEDATGKSLAVIAGDVSLDGAKIVRTDGSLEIISVRSPGEVRVPADAARPLNASSFTKLGRVTLRNSASLEAGRVVIRGGVLSLEKSSIAASGQRSGDRADARLQRKILLTDESSITSTAAASTPEQPALSLKAPKILLSGLSTVASAPPQSAAGARNLRIETGDLEVSGGAQIVARDGGNVAVQANRARLLGTASNISRQPSSIMTAAVGGTAGAVVLQVGGELTIRDGARVESTSPDINGDLFITAEAASIIGISDRQTSTGILNNSQRFSDGDAGDIHLDVSGRLSLAKGGRISSETFGPGQVGSIFVSAGSLRIAGQQKTTFSGGISTNVETPFNDGRSGKIQVAVSGDLEFVKGGQIASLSGARTPGGDIDIRARNMLIVGGGAGTKILTGVNARTLGRQSGGRGGDVRIVIAGDLIVTAAGGIVADTFFAGNGGGVHLSVGKTLHIADFGLVSALTKGSGDGGSVIVKAHELLVSTGGAISAGTAGTGKGGTIDVTAKEILISKGDGSGAAIITAESTNPGMGGDGGDVSIDAGSLKISGAPDFKTGISARSLGAGESGSVRLQLGTLTLDAKAFIGSSNEGAGKAGSVMVRAIGDIFMRGGSLISTSAAQADAGSIDIASGTRIDLRENASITASAGLNGGSITVAAPDFIHLIDSSITAIAGTTPSPVGGQGGNISIDPEFMVLEHSFIKADAAIGRGGNIFLQAANFLSSETSITATGTTAGTVEIVAPELDLSAALVILPGGLVDASRQLREECARRLGLDFSSFLVIGRGGVSLAPDEPLAEYGSARKRNPAR